MCFRLIEVYAVCKCVYFIHGIDQCNSFGTHGHSIQDRTVLVGCTCPSHAHFAMSSPPPSSTASSYPSSITSSNSTGSPYYSTATTQGGIAAQIRQQQEAQAAAQAQAQAAQYYGQQYLAPTGAVQQPQVTYYTATGYHGYSR